MIFFYFIIYAMINVFQIFIIYYCIKIKFIFFVVVFIPFFCSMGFYNVFFFCELI